MHMGDPVREQFPVKDICLGM